MTMTTRIRVLDPIDPHEFFRHGQSLLAQRDTLQRPIEQQIFSDEQSEWKWDKGCWTIANQLGQGLPGIWDVDYRPSEPLRTEDDGHDEYCNEDGDCTGEYHNKTCYLEASIDTAYGYQDDHGGAGNLHAWFLAQLMNWLDERNARYSWYDESGGVWYSSAADLVQLCQSVASAQEWFRNIAQPAIEQEAKKSGGNSGMDVSKDPFICTGCHSGDFADFDHFCDRLNVTTEETPIAFAAWLNRRTGWDGEVERIHN